MDTMQLQLFLSLSKTLNFTKTANEFYVTQPTVSDWEQNKKDPSGERLKKLAEYFGVDEAELWERNISVDNLPYPWKKELFNFCRVYSDRVVPDTPFKPDAVWAVDELRSRGHRIVIITARTTSHYTDPYATSAEELKRAGIHYDKLICATDKADACVEENIDVLIDDYIPNCDAAAEKGIEFLLK